MAETVEVLVPGGKATAGPPLGPALGPLGINVKAVVEEINKKTVDFNGMQVPVTVTVDDKRNFTIEVGDSAHHGSRHERGRYHEGFDRAGVRLVAGNLPLEAAVRIARMKFDDMLSYDLKSAVKEVVGTCVSVGVTVEGKKPREMISAINDGEYDSVLVA